MVTIKLVNTSAGTRYGQPDYVGKGCGMGRDATLYLLERGVRLTGTDAWSWDAPFSYTAQRYAQDVFSYGAEGDWVNFAGMWMVAYRGTGTA